MDLTQIQPRVARALAGLEASIAALTNALAHSNVDIEVHPGGKRGALECVCNAYASIDYEMQDEVGASPVCLGTLGVDAEIVRRVEAVNALKVSFKSLCAPLRRVQMRAPTKGEATPTRKMSAMRVILRNIGRSDLNLLAAYRKIPLLQAAPETITYTRAVTRSVYRKSIEELYVLLNDKDGLTASQDRARLASLDRRETHLAFVKEHYPNVRANVLYARLDARGRGRVQIAAELPIIYVKARGVAPPRVQFPSSEDPGTEVRRVRESKLEAKPFLQSLLVYRYTHP